MQGLSSLRLHERCTRSVMAREPKACPRVTLGSALRRHPLNSTWEEFSIKIISPILAANSGLRSSRREPRYIAQTKIHFAHLMAAAVMDVAQLLRWMAGELRACTPKLRYERLYDAVA